MSERAHHRPTQREAEFFDEFEGGADPALVREAGDLAATLLVRGVHDVDATDAPAIAERVLRLAETEGIETIAEVWSGAPADSLAGCLWRLYLLRSWVHAAPAALAADFEEGRSRAPVARVVAGVADPPGPEQLKAMVDAVLRGIAQGDFADVLFRASAFARVVAAGRASRASSSDAEVRRTLTLAEQLEAAGHLELSRGLA